MKNKKKKAVPAVILSLSILLAAENMDTAAEFCAGSTEDRRFRCLNAKHIVGEWLKTHGPLGLTELIETVNGGGDFGSAFGG